MKMGMEKHACVLDSGKYHYRLDLLMHRDKSCHCSCFSYKKVKELCISSRPAVLCILYIFVFKITSGCRCNLQSSERLSTFPKVTERENGRALIQTALQNLDIILCASPPLGKRNMKLESYTRYFLHGNRLKCFICVYFILVLKNTIMYIYTNVIKYLNCLFKNDYCY